MEVYFFWGGIGVLILTLLFGFLDGLRRGLKRSALHVVFFAGAVVLAYFLTTTVTNAVLNITITIEGVEYTINEYIMKMVQTNIDLTQFEAAGQFIEKIPSAILSPILFMLLVIVSNLIFNIIYLIVARVSFGKKKVDFEKHKPYRAYGGLIVMVESFMFLVVLFAPITSLTKTYQEIVQLPATETTVIQAEGEQTSKKMLTIGELLADKLPPQVNEAIFAFNDCAVAKVTGVAGIDDLLFDGLSTFKINNEKIAFRKEVLSLTEIYDEVVVVYNEFVEPSERDINVDELKLKLDKFLNNGLFKAVIADTIQSAVVNFDQLVIDFNIQNVPEILQNVINDLKVVFSSEDFIVYDYLKNDILKLVDVAGEVLENDLIDKIQVGEGANFTEILNVIGQNSEAISSIVKDVLGLNLVSDSFATLGEFASQKISEMFQNDQGLEFGLNTDIEDKNQMVDDILGAVDSFIELNKVVDFGNILESGDFVGSISNIDDLDGALTKMGQTFDNLRELKVLVLPVTTERLEEVKVFDNILTLYGLNLLQDEVYLTADAENRTKLDTYTKFFNFIKEPIIKAKNLQMLEMLKDNTDVTFEIILDNILMELDKDEDNSLLSDILLPFYQLSAMDLKTVVFDNVINMLAQNTNNIINLDEIKAEAEADTETGGVKVWNRELVLIAKTLKELNQGSGEKTYLESVLDANVEFDTLIEQIVNDGKVVNVLDPIFTSKAFKTLTEQIFTSMDNSIGEITKVTPDTKPLLSRLEDEQQRAGAITVLENVVKIMSSEESNELLKLGTLLDSMKENAKNDGVFDEMFINLIWYLTGDDISESGRFDGQQPNSSAPIIKAEIGVETLQGYYDVASYKAIIEGMSI